MLEQIDFDAYQKIRFRERNTLWAGPGDSAYPVRFFHLGRYFKTPVRIYTVSGGQARELLYDADAFDYADTGFRSRLPSDLGWAGFRVMNHDGDTDWLAFLGASYFRSAGPLDQYGLSARGVAIDTALPATPEEFPRFTEFWLHRTDPGSDVVLVDALLDGPSLTGAYRFNISRRDTVVAEIRAELFLRKDIQRLGIAPLTSMYWFSESNRRDAPDWRPEIHDSDGLALWTGAGERLWRPLNNPDAVRVNTFTDHNPRGFGLLQRDRDFRDYQDDGAFYEKRPAVWVEPIGEWGRGQVQLLEMPTDDEIHDNIAAYWVPAAPARAGSAWTFNYRLHWVAREPYPPESVGRVVATRIGRGGVPGQPRPKHSRKFVIDFEGGGLDDLKQRFDVDPVITASRGRVSNTYALKVVGTRHWRGAFDLEVDGKDPVDLRCYLALNGRVLTETWLYQHLPFKF